MPDVARIVQRPVSGTGLSDFLGASEYIEGRSTGGLLNWN